MREVICINIFKSGIKLGKACQELFCLEHRIQSDEKIVLGKIIGGGDDCFNIFFSEIGK